MPSPPTHGGSTTTTSHAAARRHGIADDLRTPNVREPVDDELIEQLAQEAEAGYDIDEVIANRGKRGRPPLGSAPSTVESSASTTRNSRSASLAEPRTGVPVSEVIRQALRRYLETG